MGRNTVSVLLLCLCFQCVYLTRVGTDSHWDLLIFTQHWPATVCKEWKHNPSHSCSLPKKSNSWTVHGIWPTKFKSMGPEFCNRTWHFDPEEVKPIEPQLMQSWINIEAGTSEYGLWAHEWNKHGTCAAIVEPLNSQIKYFTKGLDLLSKYSMNRILEKASITPSNDKEYSVIDIHNAVKSSLNVNPVIECRKDEGKSYLFEIRICFNKSLEFADCDGVVYHQKWAGSDQILTNCDKSQGLLYPPDGSVAQPNRLYVQLYKFVTWLQWFTL